MLIGEVRRGGALDHFLIAPLQRAVAFKQMDDLAMQVAKNLHLDMACAVDKFLEKHLVVAEGRVRLAPPGGDLFQEVVFFADQPHPAPAAAPAGLEHDRVAHLGGKALNLTSSLGSARLPAPWARPIARPARGPALCCPARA